MQIYEYDGYKELWIWILLKYIETFLESSWKCQTILNKNHIILVIGSSGFTMCVVTCLILKQEQQE